MRSGAVLSGRVRTANIAADNTSLREPLVRQLACDALSGGSTGSNPVGVLADAIAPRYRGLVILAAFTGLRFGELRACAAGGSTCTALLAPDDGNVQRDRHGASHFTRPKSRASVRTVAIRPR
jgi:hypothetical protein